MVLCLLKSWFVVIFSVVNISMTGIDVHKCCVLFAS